MEQEIKPVKIKSKSDIQAALMPFLIDGHQLRESLLEGMEIVRKRFEFNKKTESGLDVNQMRFWVDKLISERLGGKRVGMQVVWILDGKKYQFDPVTKGLIET